MGFDVWCKEYIEPDKRETLVQWTHKYTCGALHVYISKRHAKSVGEWYKHWVEVSLPNGNISIDYYSKYDFREVSHIDEIKKHYGIDV